MISYISEKLISVMKLSLIATYYHHHTIFYQIIVRINMERLALLDLIYLTQMYDVTLPAELSHSTLVMSLLATFMHTQELMAYQEPIEKTFVQKQFRVFLPAASLLVVWVGISI